MKFNTYEAENIFVESLQVFIYHFWPNIFIFYGEILIFRTLRLNTNHIIAQLEIGSGSAAVDVVFMPPESDGVSDGDSNDDEVQEGGGPGYLHSGQHCDSVER